MFCWWYGDGYIAGSAGEQETCFNCQRHSDSKAQCRFKYYIQIKKTCGWSWGWKPISSVSPHPLVCVFVTFLNECSFGCHLIPAVAWFRLWCYFLMLLHCWANLSFNSDPLLQPDWCYCCKRWYGREPTSGMLSNNNRCWHGIVEWSFADIIIDLNLCTSVQMTFIWHNSCYNLSATVSRRRTECW